MGTRNFNFCKNKAVREAVSDARGNFMFTTPPRGDYELASGSAEWHISWPVTVTGSKEERVCKHPLEVVVSLKTCGASVSKKGYYPKF